MKGVEGNSHTKFSVVRAEEQGESIDQLTVSCDCDNLAVVTITKQI